MMMEKEQTPHIAAPPALQDGDDTNNVEQPRIISQLSDERIKALLPSDEPFAFQICEFIQQTDFREYLENQTSEHSHKKSYVQNVMEKETPPDRAASRNIGVPLDFISLGPSSMHRVPEDEAIVRYSRMLAKPSEGHEGGVMCGWLPGMAINVKAIPGTHMVTVLNGVTRVCAIFLTAFAFFSKEEDLPDDITELICGIPSCVDEGSSLEDPPSIFKETLSKHKKELE